MIIAYEVLTVQPDFTENPTYGIEDERETVNSPGGGSFAAWNGKTDRTFLFDFQLSSAEEWRGFREFFDRMGGRAGAFYLPSWQHDFELAEDVAEGEAQICVAGHWHSQNMIENRPDTLGRVIFTMNHLGQFSTHLVTSVGEDGENDVLSLSKPSLSAMEAGRTVVGFCYLSRLVNDTIETAHPSPDDARATLGFREITQTRRVNQREVAEGEDIESMKGNEDIIATDEDPILGDPFIYEAPGPVVRGVPQVENFQTPWSAVLDTLTNTVSVEKTGFSAVTSLYNAPGAADKVALAFDAASREVIAWGIDGEVWIAWNSGGIQRVNFPGISPVAYNTFAIDALADAGTATLAVFYLKAHDSTIYCRIIAENFATEHRFCKSPLAPLRLFRARKLEGRIELVGIDTGHRRARWRSAEYQTPLPVEYLHHTVEPLEGLYRSVAVFAPVPESGFAANLDSVEGIYRSVLVTSLGNSEPGFKSDSVTISGTYISVKISAAASEPGFKALALDLAGSYYLVRIQSTAAEAGLKANDVTLTGTYAPP